MPTNRRIKHKTKDRFKKRWNKVSNSLSRRITAYLPEVEAECPNCYYDKVNRVSSGVAKSSPGDPNYFTVGRCPVCNGKGVLTTVRKRYLKGMVIWNPSGDELNSLTFTSAGYEGATLVELKLEPKDLDLVKQAKYIVVDGVKCKLAQPPIIRGIGGKHILIAYFFTSDKPNTDSGETYN